MKQFGLVLTLTLAVIFSSCSGDDDNGGGGGSAAAGTIKARIGGSNFTSLNMASFAMKQATGSVYMITLQGSDASGNAIQLILNGVNGQPGTFEISPSAGISAIGSYTKININTSNPMASTSTTWAAPYESSGVVGSITISEITDTNVKGTFNFKGKNQEGSDTKEVTNGAFNLNFQSN